MGQRLSWTEASSGTEALVGQRLEAVVGQRLKWTEAGGCSWTEAEWDRGSSATGTSVRGAVLVGSRSGGDKNCDVHGVDLVPILQVYIN